MNELDEKIKEALKGTENEAAFKNNDGLVEDLVGVFSGKRSRWIAFAVFISFALFAVAVWTGFKCYYAEVIRTQLLWGGTTIWSMLSIGMFKIYFWMEMHTNRVLREMKRIELLILQERK